MTTIKLVALALFSAGAVLAQNMPADYDGVLKTLGKQGDYKANVLKINIPRNDLKVTIDGAGTPTPFGFGGWIAMTKGDGGHEVMMGDLVLLEDEVNPVMSALLENGLEVTALHNHFFWEQPRVFYMHVHGHGKPGDLARKLKPALDLIGHAPAQAGAERLAMGGVQKAGKAVQVVEGKLDVEKLDNIIGRKHDQTGPVSKFTIGRDDLQIREMGATINARMGLNTWAAFVGTDENGAIAGDVAMLGTEVTPVLKALRNNGL